MNRRSIRLFAVVTASVAAGTMLGAWLWTYYTKTVEARSQAALQRYWEAVEQTPFGRQRNAVKARMHDPGSAEFRHERPAQSMPTWWCGEVNGRNRMGGLVGYTKYIVYLNTADASGSLDEAEFAPGSDAAPEAQRDFASRYDTLCA